MTWKAYVFLQETGDQGEARAEPNPNRCHSAFAMTKDCTFAKTACGSVPMVKVTPQPLRRRRREARETAYPPLNTLPGTT